MNVKCLPLLLALLASSSGPVAAQQGKDDPEFVKWSEKMERVEHLADLLVEKHRHGPTTKIELFFDDRFTRFKDLSERAM